MEKVWHLTIEEKRKFERTSLLPIQESDDNWDIVIREAEEEGRNLDEELSAELQEIREELLTFLPQRFHPYIHNRTINTPLLAKDVRNDYIEWMHGQQRIFEMILEQAGQGREEVMPILTKNAQEIFQDSLHDGVIANIERSGNDVAIMLNMESGFTPKAMIVLRFINVWNEEGSPEIGSWYIYDELRKVNGRVALRVIFDCPEMQWTIECETIEAAYYFRPASYFEREEGIGLQDYIESLNSSYRYAFISDSILPWDLKMPAEKADGLYIEEVKVAETAAECIERIYCDTYEDPYAVFSIPLPVEELEEAALGDDVERRVRAFNTLYDNPSPNKEIINRIFHKIIIHEENEMMVSIMVNHFKKIGILDEKNTKKFQNILD
ncbi:DUF4085 family protein [Lysinibacillus sp. 3P01SB]|uniref:DUF4085 family protein n=1 Tax=Lysinibacillus sp. 3P01SB TaxID=3132284 RepID=UPI0039A71AAC